MHYTRIVASIALITTALASISARAANISGTVDMLEVWTTGNVSFTLSTAVGSCNGQFILNVSNPGTKNIYAMLLAARHAGKQVRVYTSDVCIAADGLGGSYNQPLYVYAVD